MPSSLLAPVTPACNVPTPTPTPPPPPPRSPTTAPVMCPPKQKHHFTIWMTLSAFTEANGWREVFHIPSIWISSYMATDRAVIAPAADTAAPPCRTKRQYLLTLQVSRYCLLALPKTAVWSTFSGMYDAACSEWLVMWRSILHHQVDLVYWQTLTCVAYKDDSEDILKRSLRIWAAFLEGSLHYCTLFQSKKLWMNEYNVW